MTNLLTRIKAYFKDLKKIFFAKFHGNQGRRPFLTYFLHLLTFYIQKNLMQHQNQRIGL